MKTGLSIKLILTVVLGATICMVAAVGLVSFWTDSEIWAAVFVRHMFSEKDLGYDFWIKPLFHVLLWFSLKISEGWSVHPIVIARAFFALNCLAMLLLFQRLNRRLSGSSYVSAALLALLVSNSVFIKRIGQVRSDILVTTLILAWFVASQSSWWRGLRPKAHRVLWSIGLISVAATITPKSLLFTLPWLWLNEGAELRQAVRRKKTSVKIAIAGAAFVGIALCLHSMRFFTESLGLGGDEMGYFDPHRGEHVWRLIRENPPVVLVLALNFYIATFLRRKLSNEARHYVDFSNFTLLILALYPDRLPFMIASLVPFWFLPAAAAWPVLRERDWLKKVSPRRAFAAILAFGLTTSWVWGAHIASAYGNSDQKIFLNWISAQREELKPLTIYDAVGVYPFDNARHWFLGPAEHANNLAVGKRIEDSKPDLIFMVPKLYYIGESSAEFINQNYWTDGAGLHIRRILLGVHAGNIDARDLRKVLDENFPAMRDNPKHKFYMELRGIGGIDVSRYGSWSTRTGLPKSFETSLSFEELEEYQELLVPRGTVEIMILPVMLSTPYSSNWTELFRFNPEI